MRTQPALGRLLAAQGVAFIFFALVLPIEVVFAVETLDAGDTGYGLLLASWGVGMFIGSTLFAVLGRVRLPVLLVVSTAAIGAAYLGTSIAPTLAVACAASVVGGIGNGVQWIALVTAVQELTRAVLSGARPVAARGARERDARDRVPARRRDRRHPQPAPQLRGRRRRCAGGLAPCGDRPARGRSGPRSPTPTTTTQDPAEASNASSVAQEDSSRPVLTGS